jgi:hypothetical protein
LATGDRSSSYSSKTRAKELETSRIAFGWAHLPGFEVLRLKGQELQFYQDFSLVAPNLLGFRFS